MKRKLAHASARGSAHVRSGRPNQDAAQCVVIPGEGKIPTVAVTLREGARALDHDLADVARSFRIGRVSNLRHIVLPQLYPFLLVAARSGLALVWKIVLVAELLGRSDGVGFAIQLYFQQFDVTEILAYTIAFTAVVQAIEWGILQPLEQRSSRWRR